MVLPSSAVCQEQSFAVQSEVWLLLPSDNKTCGLRREQDVCRRCRREKCEEHYLCKKINLEEWKNEVALTSVWRDPTPPPAQYGLWVWSRTLRQIDHIMRFVLLNIQGWSTSGVLLIWRLRSQITWSVTWFLSNQLHHPCLALISNRLGKKQRQDLYFRWTLEMRVIMCLYVCEGILTTSSCVVLGSLSARP